MLVISNRTRHEVVHNEGDGGHTESLVEGLLHHRIELGVSAVSTEISAALIPYDGLDLVSLERSYECVVAHSESPSVSPGGDVVLGGRASAVSLVEGAVASVLLHVSILTVLGYIFIGIDPGSDRRSGIGGLDDSDGNVLAEFHSEHGRHSIAGRGEVGYIVCGKLAPFSATHTVLAVAIGVGAEISAEVCVVVCVSLELLVVLHIANVEVHIGLTREKEDLAYRDIGKSDRLLAVLCAELCNCKCESRGGTHCGEDDLPLTVLVGDADEGAVTEPYADLGVGGVTVAAHGDSFTSLEYHSRLIDGWERDRGDKAHIRLTLDGDYRALLGDLHIPRRGNGAKSVSLYNSIAVNVKRSIKLSEYLYLMVRVACEWLFYLRGYIVFEVNLLTVDGRRRVHHRKSIRGGVDCICPGRE